MGVRQEQKVAKAAFESWMQFFSGGHVEIKRTPAPADVGSWERATTKRENRSLPEGSVNKREIQTEEARHQPGDTGRGSSALRACAGDRGAADTSGEEPGTRESEVKSFPGGIGKK